MKIDKIKEGEFIMHVAGKDVCWQVVQVLKQDRFSARFLVLPWNLGYTGRPWLISDEQQVVFLGRSELDDWRVLDPEIMTKPRRESGLPPECK